LQTGKFPASFPAADRLGNIGQIIKADSWEGPYEIIGALLRLKPTSQPASHVSLSLIRVRSLSVGSSYC
jgi:hypothetical protein